MSEVEHGPITNTRTELESVVAALEGLKDAVSSALERIAYLEGWAQEHDTPATHVQLIGGLEGMGGD